MPEELEGPPPHVNVSDHEQHRDHREAAPSEDSPEAEQLLGTDLEDGAEDGGHPGLDILCPLPDQAQHLEHGRHGEGGSLQQRGRGFDKGEIFYIYSFCKSLLLGKLEILQYASGLEIADH